MFLPEWCYSEFANVKKGFNSRNILDFLSLKKVPRFKPTYLNKVFSPVYNSIYNILS